MNTHAPEPQKQRAVHVPADHPAWNAIDDDDWNGHTFGNWLRTYIKGATVVIWPPPDYGDRLGRFLAALMNAGADRIVRGASQPVSDDGGPIEENCNAGPMGPREFAKQVAALLDTDESVDDWEDRLQKIGDARTENEKLRIALAACANHAAGYQCVSGMCSTEFLLGVPEEVRLQIGARERDRDANKAALVRVEAERDALRAEFSEAVQDIPVCGGETFGNAARRIVAERDVAVARIAELETAIKVDLGRADRDAIYRHDLKALAADGASDGCHTDVGTIVRIRLAGLQAELAELRPKPACGNRFMAHVCIKREGHRDLHGDGDGGEWS